MRTIVVLDKRVIGSVLADDFWSWPDRVERTNRATHSSKRSDQLHQEHHKEKSQRHPSSIALIKRVKTTAGEAGPPVIKDRNGIENVDVHLV